MPLGQLLRAGHALGRRLQLLHALDRGVRHAGAHEEPADRPQRHRQARQVGHEGVEVAQGEAGVLEHEPAAEKEHDHQAHLVHHREEALEQGLQADHALLGALALLEHAVEEALLGVLHAETQHDARAREAGFDGLHRAAHGLLALVVAAVLERLGLGQQPHDQRQGQRGGEGQLPVQAEHHGQAEGQDQPRLDGPEDARAGIPAQLVALVDVVGEARHQVARLEALEEVVALGEDAPQLLQADAQGHGHVHPGAGRGQEGLGEAAQEAHRQQHEHPVARARQVGPAAGVRHRQRVDDELEDQRIERARGDGQHGEREDHAEAAPFPPPVGRVPAKHSSQHCAPPPVAGPPARRSGRRGQSAPRGCRSPRCRRRRRGSGSPAAPWTGGARPPGSCAPA